MAVHSHAVWGTSIAVTMSLGLTAAPASAQDATDAEPPTDIVVTANKRAERLQDVPASVTVLDAPDLTKQGLVRFTDYASRVPGLSLTSVRTGQAQVTLRGITTGAAQSASATGYYIDEAPVGSVNAYTGGSATTPDLDPADLAQIEALKGPQGTLYGAGAVGGLLKFVTTPTDLDEPSARVATTIDAVASGAVGYAARGLLNLPLATDALALRVSGFYRRDAGYIDNVNPRIGRRDINGARVRGGRAVLSMRFGPDVRLDVSANGQDTTSTGTNTVDVDAVTLVPIHGDLTHNRNVRERGVVQFRLYNATLHADLGALDLVSSTTYQHSYFSNRTDATRTFGRALGARYAIPNLGVLSTQITRSERWSQELRLGADAVANGVLDLQGGLYWTREDDSNRIPGFDPFITTTGAPAMLPGTIVKAAIVSSYREYSLFGNARLHLGERFDMLGGVRYSHDDQDYRQDYAGLIIGPRRINTGNETGDIVTWMVTPRYRLSPNAMLYAKAATGYRPGGPNAVPPPSVIVAPDTFSPDRPTQYELGFKASTPGNLLTVDTALFYTDWTDIQIQTSAAGFNFFVNGGRARSQGGELTLRLHPARRLNIGANAAYTDARLTEAAPAAGGLAGDRLPYVPRLSGSLTADYGLALKRGLSVVLGGGINYVGERWSDYSLRFPKRLAAYATVDLRAGLASGNVSLSMFAKNLGDTRAINLAATAGLTPSNTSGAIYTASFIQPRMIGAEGSLKF